ncbi:glycoside hydrolase family 6 protein [Leifsonia sp. McL0607]|uniref:glycoside hydrolase family 6 protein n=1 Tax=Leifsonia sp. McL0607 TaxID=3415672 RepID=UPI003CF83AB3
MSRRVVRRGGLALTAISVALALTQLAGAAPALADPNPQPLPPATRFFTPTPSAGAVKQVGQLIAKRDLKDAALITKEIATPQAVWFTDGTAAVVKQKVRTVVVESTLTRTVPTLVVYNVPGRDCSQYSSGGAGSDEAYRTWVDGLAAGLSSSQRVIVIVEPDGLANLPSDCPSAYPGQDVAALTAGRIADIKYAGMTITKSDPQALVYLDAGHSAWHSVGDITTRLEQAGVADVQGFSLNVSNYQFTPNLEEYGSWVSDCLAYTTSVKAGDTGSCGDMYWSGGPANNWTGTALNPNGQWSPTATDSALNTAGIDSRYASILGTATPTAHYVLDTSRNGRGPWAAPASAGYPDPQTWCNPPGAGLGARPQAAPAQAAYPLLDAFLWVKTPGQSDGQCNRGISGSTTDPEWGGIVDPAAGAWFPQQALQLAQNAVPSLF